MWGYTLNGGKPIQTPTDDDMSSGEPRGKEKGGREYAHGQVLLWFDQTSRPHAPDQGFASYEMELRVGK